MSADVVYLLVLLSAALVLLYKGWIRHDLVALSVMVATMFPWKAGADGLVGILSVEQAVSGFGSPALIMVGSMFVLSAATVRTGAADLLGRKLLQVGARSEFLFQLTVLCLVTAFSAVINDTATVLMWMPVVLGVCRERGYAPSRVLILLAYASLLGGQWTLVGTRSNIIISDYLRRATGEGLGFFTFAPVAATVFAAVVAWFVLAGRRLLPPVRDEPTLSERYDVQEYLTEVLLEPTSDLVGKRLDELEVLRDNSTRALQVVRDRESFPARPWVRLREGDVLVVQGRMDEIANLLAREGLKPLEELQVGDQVLKRIDLVMAEAVVPPGSGLEGRTLSSLDLPGRFELSVLALARPTRRRLGRPLRQPLRAGDSVLLVGHEEDMDRLRAEYDLLLLERRSLPPADNRKGYLALALLGAMVAVSASGLVTPAFAIPMAALLAVLLRCVSLREAYASMDLRALMVLGGMIPLGLALEESGTAELVARSALAALEGYDPWWIFAGSLLVAVLLTQVVENAAVAVIMAPVSYQIALASGARPEAFLLGIAICISTAFMTPVAHESTILVVQPGGYEFRDFLRMGTPLALLTWLATVTFLPLIYPLEA
jgi:di/tricarboxylate transporter